MLAVGEHYNLSIDGLDAKQKNKVIKHLIANGGDINARDSEGENALMYAAKAGDLDTVRLLLDKGMDVNGKDNENKTVLMYATESGNADLVSLLTERGAQVNDKDKYGETALMHGVRSFNGNDKIIPILVAKGADVNARNINGETALILAGNNGGQIKALLASNANPHLKDHTSRTALEAVASIASKSNEGKQAFKELLERTGGVNAPGNEDFKRALEEGRYAELKPAIEEVQGKLAAKALKAMAGNDKILTTSEIIDSPMDRKKLATTLDLNGDGKTTEQEVYRSMKAARLDMDAVENKVVAKAVLTQMAKAQQGSQPSQGSNEKPRDKLGLDTNHDGHTSTQELRSQLGSDGNARQNVQKLLSTLDADGDGKVTKKEALKGMGDLKLSVSLKELGNILASSGVKFDHGAALVSSAAPTQVAAAMPTKSSRGAGL